MELRVESADGTDLPNDCYVGVRVGDVLKQGKYEPQRCYHFPQVDRRRNAKIDVYQHIGSCVVAVDPETKSLHEVNVTSADSSLPPMRLKVSVQCRTDESSKQQREERTKVLKNQAKDYLNKHSIEERLSEAVKALLKEQPDDPTEFICRQFRSSVYAPTSPAAAGVSSSAASKPSAPAAQVATISRIPSVAGIKKVAKDDLGLLPQPTNPKFHIALVQIYNRNQQFGGSDKSSNGHRYDSIPFANGMINAGMSCQLIHYVHEEHSKFF